MIYIQHLKGGESSHFTVNVSSKMVLEAGVVWWCPGQGCAGEHLNAAVSQNIGAAAPLTHGHQMAASSPPALYHQVETYHCHLLICSYTLKMLE